MMSVSLRERSVPGGIWTPIATFVASHPDPLEDGDIRAVGQDRTGDLLLRLGAVRETRTLNLPLTKGMHNLCAMTAASLRSPLRT